MEKYDKFHGPLGYKYIKDVIKLLYLHSAIETTYCDGFYFQGELHPFWEFVYVISDGAVVSGDDRVYYLSGGDIIFHKPLEFHRVWVEGDMRPRVFTVTFQIEGALASSFENGVYSLNDLQKSKMHDLMDYLRENTIFGEDEWDSRYGDSFLKNWQEPHIPQNVANRVEALLLSILEDKTLVVKKEDVREDAKLYKEIVSILVENLHGQITLEEIAKQCKMSKSQIKKKFAAISNMGIHKFFLKLKIAEAMRLLSEDYTINEVSRILDFSTPNYFSMTFKREMGISPLAYKNSIMR